MTRSRVGLLALLFLDGAGVTTVAVVAALTQRPGAGPMAAFAAAGWLLAVVSIPWAMRSPTPPVLTGTRVHVWAGLAVTALGVARAIADFPSLFGMAMVLLAGTVAVSVAYLALLRRLARSDAVAVG